MGRRHERTWEEGGERSAEAGHPPTVDLEGAAIGAALSGRPASLAPRCTVPARPTTYFFFFFSFFFFLIGRVGGHTRARVPPFPPPPPPPPTSPHPLPCHGSGARGCVSAHARRGRLGHTPKPPAPPPPTPPPPPRGVRQTQIPTAKPTRPAGGGEVRGAAPRSRARVSPLPRRWCFSPPPCPPLLGSAANGDRRRGWPTKYPHPAYK